MENFDSARVVVVRHEKTRRDGKGELFLIGRDGNCNLDFKTSTGWAILIKRINLGRDVCVVKEIGG